MSDLIGAVNDNNFAEMVLNADGSILVDFWAEWCQPCKALAPVLEKVAEHYGNKLKIVKLNIDESTRMDEAGKPLSGSEYATKFGIRSIPTLLLFREGQVVATKIGGGSLSQLIAFLDSHL